MSRTVGIIGTGLIGGSIGMALQPKKYRTLGWDLNPANAERAERLGAIDKAVADFRTDFAEVDIAVVASPPDAITDNVAALAEVLPKNALITDVGSVKRQILKALENKLKPPPHFIGSHPIAGTEHSGPEAATEGLFDGRWCVITPTRTTPPSALEKLKDFWRDVGMDTLVMDARRHDSILALTSHLPHLIAYALTDQALRAGGGKKPVDDIARLSAGGLRDFTRIAASDTRMWRAIFTANIDELEIGVKEFARNANELLTLIKEGRNDRIDAYLNRAKKLRDRVVREKQN